MAENETGSKLSIIRIVQILLRESDVDHPMTQQEIVDCLWNIYGMNVNRKSVSRNLNRLKDAGLPVNCREVTRVVNGKESSLSLDWYWEHVLSPTDLQQVIDLLYFSHLPTQQVAKLSEKLKSLQCRSFSDGKENIRNIPANPKAVKPEVALDLVSKALAGKKKISFFYDHYEADGKRHHGRTPSGEDKRFIASPFQIVSADDRYCLLANESESNKVKNFYLDLMDGMEIMEEAADPPKVVPALEKGEKLSDYLSCSHRIFEGFPEECSFEADWHLMTDIVADFGKAAHLVSARQDRVTVEITWQPEALKAWALSHAPLVKILSPAHLVKEVKEAVADMNRLYGNL